MNTETTDGRIIKYSARYWYIRFSKSLPFEVFMFSRCLLFLSDSSIADNSRKGNDTVCFEIAFFEKSESSGKIKITFFEENSEK